YLAGPERAVLTNGNQATTILFGDIGEASERLVYHHIVAGRLGRNGEGGHFDRNIAAPCAKLVERPDFGFDTILDKRSPAPVVAGRFILQCEELTDVTRHRTQTFTGCERRSITR